MDYEADLMPWPPQARGIWRILKLSHPGAALATWFEARSCERTASASECRGLSTISALGLARLCFDTLVDCGVAAKQANEAGIVTPAFERIVEANTLMSGLGFESSGLASAHSIHNGLTALAPTHAYYHGEKVAIGTLAGLHVTDADPKEMAAPDRRVESGWLGKIGIIVPAAAAGKGSWRI